MSSPLRRNPVQFTQESAQRIARVVRDAETRIPPASPLTYSPFFAGNGGGGAAVVLGRTDNVWQKDTLANIEVYSGQPLNEIPLAPPEVIKNCVNKFTRVDALKWVVMAKMRNGSWYLIAAEC